MNKLLIALAISLVSTVNADSFVTMYSPHNSGNIHIDFTANPLPVPAFEQYTCNIDFGTWTYPLNASLTIVNGSAVYRCIDQGGLQANVKYDVYFEYTSWSTNRVYRSANYTLKSN